MNNDGRLARIICAIIDIFLSIWLSMCCINDGKPEMVPLFVVIAIGMVMWLLDFTKYKKLPSFDWELTSGDAIYTQEYTVKDTDKETDKETDNEIVIVK
jgi:hypothetical protein